MHDLDDFSLSPVATRHRTSSRSLRASVQGRHAEPEAQRRQCRGIRITMAIPILTITYNNSHYSFNIVQL